MNSRMLSGTKPCVNFRLGCWRGELVVCWGDRTSGFVGNFAGTRRTEGGGRKSGVGSRRTVGGGRGTEVGGRRMEVGSRRLEGRGREVGRGVEHRTLNIEVRDLHRC